MYSRYLEQRGGCSEKKIKKSLVTIPGFGSDETVACANDLAPHYYQMLENAKFYRFNSSSIYGRPGKFQVQFTQELKFDLC